MRIEESNLRTRSGASHHDMQIVDITKNAVSMQPTAFTLNRSDGIRTHDLCVPNAALYQTEPRFDLFTELFNPSTVAIIRDKKEKVNT